MIVELESSPGPTIPVFQQKFPEAIAGKVGLFSEKMTVAGGVGAIANGTADNTLPACYLFTIVFSIAGADDVMLSIVIANIPSGKGMFAVMRSHQGVLLLQETVQRADPAQGRS